MMNQNTQSNPSFTDLEKKKYDEAEGEPDFPSNRKLYRPVSRTSVGADAVEMAPLTSSGASLHKSQTSLKSRTPSGKSVRSRRVSEAQYHGDLKQDLKRQPNSGLTVQLVFMSFIILLGNTFLFGYNIGVLNQPTALIQEFYNQSYSARRDNNQSYSAGRDNNQSYSARRDNESDSEVEEEIDEEIDEDTMAFLWSLTTSLFIPAGMIGAFTAGFIADKLGRKGAVILNCIPSIIGGAMSTACVGANAPELLMAGRFICGLSCGMGTALGPMYLMEICPFNFRGAFGTVCQLFCTIGIFIASVLGLRELLGTTDLWPYLLLVNTIAATLCLIVMPFLPDSPRYLMLIKRDRVAAEKALQFIRNTLDVSVDMEEMETEFKAQQKGSSDASGSSDSYTMMRLLRTKDLHMPLLITVMLQVIQQLSGINAIFFYSTSIFKGAGVAVYAIQYAVVLTCGVNVAMTIIAVPIMDKAGRRPLLLYPMGAMIVILGIIVLALKYQSSQAWLNYVSIACVISYVISFAIGLGPIPSMLSAELFRQGPRPRAMSLGGLTNWTCTLIVGLSFELIQHKIKEYTFLIFFFLMIAFIVFVFFKVPETKNKTFEEIASKFQKGGTIEVQEIITDNGTQTFNEKPKFDLDFENADREGSQLLSKNKFDSGIGSENPSSRGSTEKPNGV